MPIVSFILLISRGAAIATALGSFSLFISIVIYMFFRKPTNKTWQGVLAVLQFVVCWYSSLDICSCTNSTTHSHACTYTPPHTTSHTCTHTYVCTHARTHMDSKNKKAKLLAITGDVCAWSCLHMYTGSPGLVL